MLACLACSFNNLICFKNENSFYFCLYLYREHYLYCFNFVKTLLSKAFILQFNIEDRSDEDEALNCNLTSEFQCAHGYRCIPREMVNDNINDCSDGSDENLHFFECHLENEFRCKNGRCIMRLFCFYFFNFGTSLVL